jgi:hypothetical protein
MINIWFYFTWSTGTYRNAGTPKHITRSRLPWCTTPSSRVDTDSLVTLRAPTVAFYTWPTSSRIVAEIVFLCWLKGTTPLCSWSPIGGEILKADDVDAAIMAACARADLSIPNTYDLRIFCCRPVPWHWRHFVTVKNESVRWFTYTRLSSICFSIYFKQTVNSLKRII